MEKPKSPAAGEVFSWVGVEGYRYGCIYRYRYRYRYGSLEALGSKAFQKQDCYCPVVWMLFCCNGLPTSGHSQEACILGPSKIGSLNGSRFVIVLKNYSKYSTSERSRGRTCRRFKPNHPCLVLGQRLRGQTDDDSLSGPGFRIKAHVGLDFAQGLSN